VGAKPSETDDTVSEPDPRTAAIAERFGARGTFDRTRQGQAGDTLEGVPHAFRLGPALLGVAQVLPGTAAANADQGATRLHPSRPRYFYLTEFGAGKAFLLLDDANLHDIAGRGCGDENDATAFIAADAFSAAREAIDA
jgi:hypothetical protein